MTQVRTLSDLDATPHATVFPDAEPRTIRLALDAGERVDPHSHPGRDVLIHVLDGAIDLHVDEETHALSGGDLTQFKGEREVSPVATEDSLALVVLAPRADEG
ncbi:cupin domain-containing protein [Halobaculum limi]|uniref:cupin domain-containing protein n=1 Tax=Halobaculum limi TaxID=3031916 RepID=UPI002406A0F6|nr:cupin domain-containing protein [Halobaculum sp. YSMS11]